MITGGTVQTLTGSTAESLWKTQATLTSANIGKKKKKASENTVIWVEI